MDQAPMARSLGNTIGSFTPAINEVLHETVGRRRATGHTKIQLLSLNLFATHTLR
jgi:hypothetical protein